MEILGFDVVLPHGVRVGKRVVGAEGVCIVFIGDDVQRLLELIVDKAEAVGFVVSEETLDRIELERGELQILIVFDSSGVTIQTHDPTNLPVADHEGSAVRLAGLRVELDCTAIAPLRERRMGELHRAAWKLSGTSAPEAVRRVIDEAVNSRGLTRGPVFAPAKGGREIWAGEAYSQLELVKARAIVESDHVRLEIDLVDKRNEGRGGSDPQASPQRRA